MRQSSAALLPRRHLSRDAGSRTKKAWLRSYGKRFAEVLSLFRSRQVRDAVEREARRSGVEVRYVDPAWTTRLGKLKYRRHCRLGPHHAAALVIGAAGSESASVCLTTLRPCRTQWSASVRRARRGRSCRGSLQRGCRVVAVAPDTGRAPDAPGAGA